MSWGARDPFFNPLWRRIATVAACAGWGGFEFWNGNTGWAALFWGIGVYCGWVFFVTWRDLPPRNPPR